MRKRSRIIEEHWKLVRVPFAPRIESGGGGDGSVIPEGLLLPVLLYRREIMIWREKERSRIRAV